MDVQRLVTHQKLDSQGLGTDGYSIESCCSTSGLIQLSDPTKGWVVVFGVVDVFIARYDEYDEPVSPLKHLLRAEMGELIFGFAERYLGDLRVTARLSPGARLCSFDLAGIDIPELGLDFAKQVDHWIESLSSAINRDLRLSASPDVVVELGDAKLLRGKTVVSAHGGLLWVKSSRQVAYLGSHFPREDQPDLVPISLAIWGTALTDVEISTVSTLNLGQEGKLLDVLASFQEIAISAEKFNRDLSLVDIANQQADLVRLRERDVIKAKAQLQEVKERGSAEAIPELPLERVLHEIGSYEDIEFKTPFYHGALGSSKSPTFDEILKTSQVRCRDVALPDDVEWWNQNQGALLAYYGEDKEAVALIPSRSGGYRIYFAGDDKHAKVNATIATEIHPQAVMFYRPFSQLRATLSELFSVAFRNSASDVIRYIFGALIVGVLALTPAVVIGELTAWVLPLQEQNVLATTALLIWLVAVLSTTAHLYKGAALTRIEGRVAAQATSSLWDRLLTLKAEHLRSHVAGDLMRRASTFLGLRATLSGFANTCVLSAVFLLPTFVFLFFYNATLALTTLLLGLIVVVVVVVLGCLQLNPQRTIYQRRREVSGVMFQFLTGIQKLRTAGAEGSAFAFWANIYQKQKLFEMRAGRLSEKAAAFTTATPFIATAVLMLVAYQLPPEELSVSQFLAVYAATLMFFSAVVGIGSGASMLSEVIPGIGQAKLLLDAEPEQASSDNGAVSASIGLTGDLKFDHISFSYGTDGRTNVSDVSIRARPGEFVSIVGASGSGKSTLFRLALGLETPTEGAVYYDGFDLSTLNRRSLQRQIGVVTQDGRLQPGTVGSNILGISKDLLESDAWRAAELVALADDVRQWPMGMQTIVGESTSFFSGGQVQRILLAAALVNNPRIVFLDEATSALDSYTQAEVMAGLSSLAVTRVVIAHRLSTIQNADYIYVMDRGSVAQEGTFDELRNRDGLFQQMIQRQIR